MPFEHSNKRIAAEVALLLGVPLLLVLIAWLSFGAVVDAAARRLPPEAEQTLGDAMAKVVGQAGQPCDAPEVTKLAHSLAVHAGLSSVEIAVLDDEKVNAFALPGGHVFIFSGLLKKAQSPDEVAGVLAHELGHVVLRHHLRTAMRTLGVGAVASALFGDTGGLGALLVSGSGQLADLAFSREQETEADEFAVELAAKAGFDPLAVGHLLERMEEPGAPPSFLRTHPSGPDRRRALEKMVAKHPPGGHLEMSMEAMQLECLSGEPSP